SGRGEEADVWHDDRVGVGDVLAKRSIEIVELLLVGQAELEDVRPHRANQVGPYGATGVTGGGHLGAALGLDGVEAGLAGQGRDPSPYPGPGTVGGEWQRCGRIRPGTGHSSGHTPDGAGDRWRTRCPVPDRRPSRRAWPA